MIKIVYCLHVKVNDLGGGFHGEGKGSRPADEVVSLIKSQGGVAVPNYGMMCVCVCVCVCV